MTDRRRSILRPILNELPLSDARSHPATLRTTHRVGSNFHIETSSQLSFQTRKPKLCSRPRRLSIFTSQAPPQLMRPHLNPTTAAAHKHETSSYRPHTTPQFPPSFLGWQPHHLTQAHPSRRNNPRRASHRAPCKLRRRCVDGRSLNADARIAIKTDESE